MYLTALWEIYGALLTDKQRECLELSLLRDYSLSEIGEVLGLSRQSVHDAIRRGENLLTDLEAKLSVYAQRQEEQKKLATLKDKIIAASVEKSPELRRQRIAAAFALMGS